jgi:hypothetical protein
MKRIVLLTLAVLCISNLAFAQEPGSIDIFSDVTMTSCNIVDVPGLVSLFVFHTHASLVASSMWMLEATDGAEGMTFVGDTVQFPVYIGTSMSGLSVVYGLCLSSPIHLVTVNFVGSGTTPPCGLFSIVPSPDSDYDQVEVADCNIIRMLIPRGGQARLNPDASCTCQVPTEKTSWGGIKALYQ